LDVKKCADCFEVKEKTFFHKAAAQKDGFSCYCKQCAKERNSKKYFQKHKDHEFKLNKTLKASKHRADKKGLEHTLTLEELKRLYPADNKCPILGYELSWGFPKDTSPSLDRIDSKKGYTYDNCQIISNKANRIKSDGTLEELEAIVNYLKEN
jgi:hypothetical protein